MTKLIINDKASHLIEVRALNYGEWLRYKDSIYIKVFVADSDKIKIVNISEGIEKLINRNTLITPIKEVEVNI